jgi:SAM-dependent methyltransferase
VLKDVCELDYVNEFDVAISSSCRQWVPDKAAAFRGIRRSLKPGRAVILVMPFRNPEIANLRKQMVRETRPPEARQRPGRPARPHPRARGVPPEHNSPGLPRFARGAASGAARMR